MKYIKKYENIDWEWIDEEENDNINYLLSFVYDKKYLRFFYHYVKVENNKYTGYLFDIFRGELVSFNLSYKKEDIDYILNNKSYYTVSDDNDILEILTYVSNKYPEYNDILNNKYINEIIEMINEKYNTDFIFEYDNIGKT
jgi:hypothetical protein